MPRQDPKRARRLRVAVRHLLEHDGLGRGYQSRLAEHFRVSRQCVHQIVTQERRHLASRGAELDVVADEESTSAA